jgi:hypothetical protein
MHIFFRVDVVVYCEGGPSLSYAEAIQPKNNDGTLDALYWSAVVRSYGSSKTFHVKSVGGKEAINAIAVEINRLGITSITVCRDSDYEGLLGKKIALERVAWTMGYSWENDVVKLPVLENLLTKLIGDGPKQGKITEELRNRIAQFELDLQHWTEIDISLYARGRTCLFDRDKPLAAIDLTAPPALRTEGLKKRLATAGFKRGPKRVATVKVADVTTICYGKLVSRALYQAFIDLLRKSTTMRIDYELFMRLAISETLNSMAVGLLPDLSAHIQGQCSAFT